METKGKNYVVYNACYGGFFLSQEALDWLVAHGATKEDTKYGGCDISRHNPLLVQCVRELGEKANGFCAELQIQEIEGNIYRIDEYDGLERIITPETEEWVTIE